MTALAVKVMPSTDREKIVLLVFLRGAPSSVCYVKGIRIRMYEILARILEFLSYSSTHGKSKIKHENIYSSCFKHFYDD